MVVLCRPRTSTLMTMFLLKSKSSELQPIRKRGNCKAAQQSFSIQEVLRKRLYYHYSFAMALYDYELELQSEIVNWNCSRHADCLMKFIREPRHVKLGMSGLVWSIQALPCIDFTGYTFNIMQVKRFKNPLALLSGEDTTRDLSAKFKLLLVGFEISIKSVFRVEEALDKFYAFSLLFSRAREGKRWWIVVDAEIAALACKSAREAVYAAAEAAAGFLVDNCQPPPLENRQKSITGCGRSGWWIEGWTVSDELWATGFNYSRKGLNVMRQFPAKAVEEGSVLQWCSVQVSDTPNPCFEFEVAVEDFMEGDDMLLRISVANDRPLRVRVYLTIDEDVEVTCCQEGVETEASLGLGYLVPEFVRDYIRLILQRNEAELSSNNVVEGLMHHVVRYLAILGNVCVVCGCQRLLEVPLSSCCSNICKARKQGYEAAIAACIARLNMSSEEKNSTKRREQFVRKLYSNTDAGRTGLEILVKTTVVEEAAEMFYYEYKLAAGRGGGTRSSEIGYEHAVGRVARMDSRSIATALGIQMSELCSGDS